MSARTPLTVPLIVAAAAVALVTRQPVSDSDLFWHLANGRDILAGTAGTDHFSWTIAGRPTWLDQWLGEILWYASYQLAGWDGIIALRAAAVGALVAIVVATALRGAPGRPLVALLAAAPAIVVSRYAWTDRPELFGLLCFAILVAVLRRDGALWAIPLLLLVWSNTHGSYVLGLVLGLLALAQRALVHRDARLGPLVIAVLAVVACAPALLGERLVSTSQFWAPPRAISEWSVPDITTMPALVFGIALVAVLVAAFTLRERDDRDLILLVPTAFVSMAATRHLPFFPIVAAPYLARAAAEVWRRWSPTVTNDLLGRRAELAATALFAIVLALAIWTAPSEPDLAGYPVAALADLPAGPGVLSEYDWGGFLIWTVPRTPVFVDGRLVPYTGAVLDDYRAIVAAHPGWEEVAARRGVRTMLVRPTDAIAVRAPDRGWRVAFRDETAVVLVR